MKVDTELLCLHCDRETNHTVIYRGKYIHRIKCIECGTEIAINSKKILGNYTPEDAGRCVSKPGKALEEMAADLAAFMSSLPVRIITKPVRLAGEFLDVFK